MKIRNYEGKTEQVKGILYALKAMNGRKVNIGKQFGIGQVYRTSIINSGLFEIRNGKIIWNKENIPITDDLVSGIVDEAKEINKEKNKVLRDRLKENKKPANDSQQENDNTPHYLISIELKIALIEHRLEVLLSKQDRIISSIEALGNMGNQNWGGSIINA